MLTKGAETAAVCTQLASSAAQGGATCSQTQVATTDSTSYSKPTTYSTANSPAVVVPTKTPETSGIEGQSMSEVQDAGAPVTVWTTTTVAAPCESSPPPVSPPAATESATPSNTCECPDEGHTEPTASIPAETSGIEGSAYSSDAPIETTASGTNDGSWAGKPTVSVPKILLC